MSATAFVLFIEALYDARRKAQRTMYATSLRRIPLHP
jgi:hypothetical protein